MAKEQPSLYDLTITTWAKAEEERTQANDPLKETSHVIEARKLEEELSDRFESPIEEFQQGLISATELMKKLIYVASFPSEETDEEYARKQAEREANEKAAKAKRRKKWEALNKEFGRGY